MIKKLVLAAPLVVAMPRVIGKSVVTIQPLGLVSIRP